MSRSYGPNRYVCSVLEEMRDQLKLLDSVNITQYRSITSMMIEEVQTLVNRMESGLYDIQDLRDLTKEKKELKLEVKKLEEKKRELEILTANRSNNGED